MFLLPWVGEVPAQVQPPEGFGTAVEELTASLDRLARLLEKDLAFRSEEREVRRVEVAVGILGLRYRKVDQSEAEIRRISHEEEEFPERMRQVKADLEILDKRGRAEAEDGQLSDMMKYAIAEEEMRIRSEEERMARQRERRLILENQLTAEQRRLADLEAILDAWLDKLQ